MKLKRTIVFASLLFGMLLPLPSQSKSKAEREREKERLERKAAADKQDAFEEAVETFQLNMPEDAIPLLEKFLGEGNANAYDPLVYVCLSVAYFQIGDYLKSASICEAGIAEADRNDKALEMGIIKEGDFKPVERKVLYFNEGNAEYAMGNYVKATALYKRSLSVEPSYAPAVLNLANAFLRRDIIGDARDNYVRYLELKPETEQRPEIEKMIALLDEEIAYRMNQGPQLVEGEIRADVDESAPPEIIDDGDIITSSSLRHGESVREALPSDDSVAPELPRDEKRAEESGERIDSSSENAPSLPVERKTKPTGEKIDSTTENAPSLPAERQTKPSGERIDSSSESAPSLPAERKTKPTGEKIDSSTESAPSLPAERETKPTGERIDSTTENAPSLPAETQKKDSGEKVRAEANPSAADTSEVRRPAQKPSGEKVRAEAPAVPDDENKKKDDGEKISAPALPDDGTEKKKQEKMERIRAQEPPAVEEEKSAPEDGEGDAPLPDDSEIETVDDAK